VSDDIRCQLPKPYLSKRAPSFGDLVWIFAGRYGDLNPNKRRISKEIRRTNSYRAYQRLLVPSPEIRKVEGVDAHETPSNLPKNLGDRLGYDRTTRAKLK
jgi:hypothetical protein